MCKYYLYIKIHRVTVEVISGMFLLVCGCAIYLLFRSRSLNIYQWCCSLGLTSIIERFRRIVQDWNVPDVIRFSLPDGMYCAAYILIVDAIWYREQGIQKYVVIALVPIITIGSELFQSLNLVRGTFDVFDLVCYALPPLVYVCIIVYQKYNYFKEQQV